MTQEVLEGEEAMVSMEILSGSLEKDVSLILRTFHETAQSKNLRSYVNNNIQLTLFVHICRWRRLHSSK